MEQPFWETFWLVLKKTKYATTIKLNQLAPGHLSQRNENSSSQNYTQVLKNLYTNAYWNCICNNQKLETIQISSSE